MDKKECLVRECGGAGSSKHDKVFELTQFSSRQDVSTHTRQEVGCFSLLRHEAIIPDLLSLKGLW